MYPVGLAWGDVALGEEIGDLCNWDFGNPQCTALWVPAENEGMYFNVQLEYSNSAAACYQPLEPSWAKPYCGLCYQDGTACIAGYTCGYCCNGYSFWNNIDFTACGTEPCWGSGAGCTPGLTCNSCCNGATFSFLEFGFYCT